MSRLGEFFGEPFARCRREVLDDEGRSPWYDVAVDVLDGGLAGLVAANSGWKPCGGAVIVEPTYDDVVARLGRTMVAGSSGLGVST